MPSFWLMKSEPTTYSIDDLAQEKSTWWEGVRNYQARNFMMNDMKPGDVVLIYHSSCEVPAIVGVAEVCEPAAPDKTAWDKKSDYFDAKATPEKPIWWCVKVRFKQKLAKPVDLSQIRSEKSLSDMVLLQKGSRLSIHPVTPKQYDIIQKLSRA